MTTWKYCIEQHGYTFKVTEADGNAPATGEYDSLDAAKDAVLKASKRTDLDWESGRSEGIDWWATEWADEKLVAALTSVAIARHTTQFDESLRFLVQHRAMDEVAATVAGLIRYIHPDLAGLVRAKLALDNPRQ